MRNDLAEGNPSARKDMALQMKMTEREII